MLKAFPAWLKVALLIQRKSKLKRKIKRAPIKEM
jgi:hypothetical protein